jgi:hypothetical protein
MTGPIDTLRSRALAKLRARSFTIDGEARYGPDGIAIFDALHRRGTVSDACCSAPSPHFNGMAWPAIARDPKPSELLLTSGVYW